MREAHKDPETLEELDKQWKEAEVFTGDPLTDIAADCNTCNASSQDAMKELNKVARGKNES